MNLKNFSTLEAKTLQAQQTGDDGTHHQQAFVCKTGVLIIN
jgi:hypothetical protein